MKKVLIIGSTQTDIAARVDHLPKSDEEIQPVSTEKRISGSGWCIANAFRILNMPYTLISPCGTGVYGDYCRMHAEQRNVSLQYVSETAGCTYTMIDPQGYTACLAVAGSEYSFQPSFVSDFQEEDYSQVICSGTQFEQDPQVLLGFLQSVHIPVIFQPGGRSILMNQNMMEHIMSIHPILHLSETEAAWLCEGKASDLNEAAGYIHEKTQAPVIILLDDLRCLYCDGRNPYVIPVENDDFTDLSGTAEGHLAGFAIARGSGLDVQRALEFAGKYAETVSVTDETIPDQAEYNRLKQALSSMILSTDIRKAGI